MNGKTILVLLAKDSAPLLDIMGLYVYQYILHEQLVERLPSCLNSIQSYLMNITSVCIHHAQGKQYIAIHDIYAFTYEEGFVYLYLQNKKISTQFTSLEKAMNLLNSDFVFVSRQTIVSLPKIDLIQKDRVILNNGESFGLSRRRKSQVIAQWEKRGELK
jgi:DNA-binding LytR/AlgR family response regulator